MRSLWGRLAAIILVFGLLGIGITYFNLTKGSVPQKPLVREPAPKNEPQILKESNRYANSIYRFDFKTAKSMSSPANIKLIDSLIIPKFSDWEKKIGGDGLRFKSVIFENAMLVNDNLDDLIVTESLNLKRPSNGIVRFYLKFRIRKSGNVFQVDNTDLIEKPFGQQSQKKTKS